MRGELEDVWSWADDPVPPQEKTAQEGPIRSRALPNVQNGDSTPQANNGTDGGHVDAEVTEGDEEEGTAEQEDGREVKPRKRKSKGRKKV